MRRVYWILPVLMLLLALVARAQEATPVDTSGYRLHTPTAEEYLAAIPRIAERAKQEGIYNYDSNHPMNVILRLEAEIGPSLNIDLFRHADPSLLHNAAQALGKDDFYFAELMTDQPDHEVEAAEAALLTELLNHPIDLNTLTSLDFELNHWPVTPIDFDGDGENEFLLGSGNMFFTARKNSLVPQGYDIAPVPLRPLEAGRPIFEPDGGYYETFLLRDVNGDNLPEWIVENRWGGWDTVYDLYMLAWRDGQLKEIAYLGSLKSPPTFTFDSANSPTPYRMHLSETRGDNWGCIWNNYYAYDWNSETATYVSTLYGTEYADSFGCAIQKAEKDMWNGDFYSAFSDYQRALAFPISHNEGDSSGNIELRQYAQIRMTVAGMVVNYTNTAEDVLTQVQSQEPASGMIADLVNALSIAHPNGLSFCNAAYGVFDRYTTFESYADIPTNIFVGYGDANQPAQTLGVPDAARAGCDLNQVTDKLVKNQTFVTDTSPTAQLEALNIPVAAALELDLDSDGRSEWLVWTQTPAKPYLFVPDANSYRISRPDITRPNDYTSLSTISLPDSSGHALAHLVTLPVPSEQLARQYNVRTWGCPDSTQGKPKGTLELWRLSFGDLVKMVQVTLCDQKNLHSLFPDGPQTIHAWVRNDPSIYTFIPGVYIWDAGQFNYLPPPFESSPTPSPEATASGTEDINYCALLTCDCGCYPVLTPFGLGYYDIALREIDDALSRSDNTLEDTQALQYYRALALEALHRSDEILAEYVEVYEAAPDSAWGMLAALHLERES